MKMLQITDENFDSLKEKQIYLINYSDYYIKELCAEFDILPHICGGCDERPHRQCTHTFQNHKIDIKDYADLILLDDNVVPLILDGYPHECYRKLQAMPGIAEKFDTIYFFADHEMKIDLAYRKQYKDTPLQNIIVFRSGAGTSQYIPGNDFSDNARALFEYMLCKHLDDVYKLVWLVRNPGEYEGMYPSRNVRFISYDDAVADDKLKRDEYYKYLCLAKFIFATHLMIFARNARKDQIRVQLWHGCAFKRSFRIPEEHQYEYMIVSSIMFAVFHSDIFGLRPDQLLITGLPKQDYLFQPVDDWQEKLNIPKAKKYIFWLPTWRTTPFPGQEGDPVINPETGLSVFAKQDDFREIDDVLRLNDIILIIKSHPWQNEIKLNTDDFSNVFLLEHRKLASTGMFINEILGDADALISDYSSAAVDYMLLDRPLAFTLDDHDVIKSHRGFHWENLHRWLPGTEIYTKDDFLQFVSDVAHGLDRFKNKRRYLKPYFHAHGDNKNSARVLAELGIE